MVRPHGQRPRSLVRVLLLAGALAAQHAYAQPSDTFSQATTAFEAGDYRAALELFLGVLANGADSPALRYNLGVCQYRVGDYAQAAATFSDLRDRFPRFAAVAEYNRGLALRALDDTDAARAAFARALSEGDEPIRALAASALATLEPQPVARALWLGYFDVGAGHDDNVALVDELSLPATSTSSPFTEVVGYASRSVGRRVPLRLDLSGYLVRYSNASQFDQEALRIDTAFSWSADAWSFEAGPRFASTVLDGDGFERALGGTLRASRSLSTRTTFELRLTHDDVDAPSDRFAFIAGTRTRLRVGLDSRGERDRWRIGYEIEANDRESASVSPSRDRLQVGYARELNERWSLDTTVAYRKSDYDDLATPRHERLTEVGAAAHRILMRGWLLRTEYRFADNDSNIAQFSYSSHRLTLAIGRSF